jgi:hypothetical protein
MKWTPCIISSKNFKQEHLYDLAQNKYSAVVIDNFVDEEYCKIASSNFEAHSDLLEYKQANVTTKYLGHSLVELAAQPELYFAKVPDMFSEVRAVFTTPDEVFPTPLELVMRLINQAWQPGVKVAEESGKHYFAGIMRAVKRSPLHNDWAPRDFYSWSIGKITSQFTWNLYLRSPSDNSSGLVKYTIKPG